MTFPAYTDSDLHSPYQDLNFAEWCEIVDTLIKLAMIASCGEPLGIMDIGDRFWIDHYTEGTTPHDAVVSEIAELDHPHFAFIAC